MPAFFFGSLIIAPKIALINYLSEIKYVGKCIFRLRLINRLSRLKIFISVIARGLASLVCLSRSCCELPLSILVGQPFDSHWC